MYIVYGLIPIAVVWMLQVIACLTIRVSIFNSVIFTCIIFWWSAYFSSAMMRDRMIKDNKKNTWFRIGICLLSGTVMFAGLFIIEYVINQLSYGWIIDYHMAKGSTIFDYFKYKMANYDVKYFSRHGRGGTLPTSGIVNYIIVLVQFGVLTARSFYAYFDERVPYYCEKCKKYYKTKELFSLKYLAKKSIINQDKFSERDLKKLDKFIRANKYQATNKNMKYSGILYYCEECRIGILEIVNKSYNKKSEDEFKKKVINLEGELLSMFIEEGHR